MPDRRHASDRRVTERIAKGVSTDHSTRTEDQNARLRTAVETFMDTPEALQKRSLKTSGLPLSSQRAPQSSRRRAGPRQIAKHRRSSGVIGVVWRLGIGQSRFSPSWLLH